MKKLRKWGFDPKTKQKERLKKAAFEKLTEALIARKVIKMVSSRPTDVDIVSATGFQEVVDKICRNNIQVFDDYCKENNTRGALYLKFSPGDRDNVDTEFHPLMLEDLLKSQEASRDTPYTVSSFMDELILKAVTIYSPAKEIPIFVTDRSLLVNREPIIVYLFLHPLAKGEQF